MEHLKDRGKLIQKAPSTGFQAWDWVPKNSVNLFLTNTCNFKQSFRKALTQQKVGFSVGSALKWSVKYFTFDAMVVRLTLTSKMVCYCVQSFEVIEKGRK